MNKKQILACLAGVYGVGISQADFARLLVDVTEVELLELQRILAEEYGIVLAKTYDISVVPPVIVEYAPSRPVKTKPFVPKNIGKVQNKVLGKRRR